MWYLLTHGEGAVSLPVYEDSVILDQTSSNLALSLGYAIKMSELGRSSR
jgi:hypothetical protein